MIFSRLMYYIIIPAYNEEQTIVPCLRSISGAVEYAKKKFLLDSTYICVNGCTDKTEEKVKIAQGRFPKLNIKILSSKKGMVRALCKIIETLPNSSYPVVKIDADTIVEKKSFYILLLSELEKHPELKIVGGYPQAISYKGDSLYKRFLSNILDVRSRYPLSQISTYNVERFHKIADTDPQPNIPADFEKKSRIYFHGRFYLLRNKKIWDVPQNQIGDDTYLTLSVYKRFGLNSIRIRYDAICYYYPTVSLRYHYNVYKRIHCDVKTLFHLPEFQSLKELKSLERVKLNWSYIRTLPLKIQFLFLCYTIVKIIETALFRLFPKYTDKLWSYKTKKC